MVAMTGLTLSLDLDVGGLLTLLTLVPIIGVIERAHARYVLKETNRQKRQWRETA